MSMTKSNYEVIANAFYTEMIQLETVKQADWWNDIVSTMANKLEIDNPKFDRVKFINACRGNK